MHHKGEVNQNLRAGQRVRINKGAKNKNLHGETAKFVKYTHAYVHVDGEHFISINSVESETKDTQRLERGDKIRIADACRKAVIKGRKGEFDVYADILVEIDGSYHRVVVRSVDVISSCKPNRAGN